MAGMTIISEEGRRVARQPLYFKHVEARINLR